MFYRQLSLFTFNLLIVIAVISFLTIVVLFLFGKHCGMTKREAQSLEELEARVADLTITVEQLSDAGNYEDRLKVFAQQWNEEMKRFEHDASSRTGELKVHLSPPFFQ